MINIIQENMVMEYILERSHRKLTHAKVHLCCTICSNLINQGQLHLVYSYVCLNHKPL